MELVTSNRTEAHGSAHVNRRGGVTFSVSEPSSLASSSELLLHSDARLAGTLSFGVATATDFFCFWLFNETALGLVRNCR